MLPLTKREEQVAEYVTSGLKNKEIAQKMCISEFTVKTHLQNIFAKLGFRGRVKLALHFLNCKKAR